MTSATSTIASAEARTFHGAKRLGPVVGRGSGHRVKHRVITALRLQSPCENSKLSTAALSPGEHLHDSKDATLKSGAIQPAMSFDFARTLQSVRVQRPRAQRA